MTRRLVTTLLAAALVITVAPADATPEHVGELVLYDRDGAPARATAPTSA